MKLLIMQFSPISHHFSLRTKYSPQYLSTTTKSICYEFPRTILARWLCPMNHQPSIRDIRVSPYLLRRFNPFSVTPFLSKNPLPTNVAGSRNISSIQGERNLHYVYVRSAHQHSPHSTQATGKVRFYAMTMSFTSTDEQWNLLKRKPGIMEKYHYHKTFLAPTIYNEKKIWQVPLITETAYGGKVNTRV
jgi:hypothetical protein